VICLHEFTWTDHTAAWTKLEWCPNCGCVRVDGKDWVQPYRDWRSDPAPGAARVQRRHRAAQLVTTLCAGVLLGLWLGAAIGG
jgi:hypothetical protein